MLAPGSLRPAPALAAATARQAGGPALRRSALTARVAILERVKLAQTPHILRMMVFRRVSFVRLQQTMFALLLCFSCLLTAFFAALRNLENCSWALATCLS